jgi:hypothetical protein
MIGENGGRFRSGRPRSPSFSSRLPTCSPNFSQSPPGVGQTQALDVATLRRYASTNDIGAFPITRTRVITLWNVVLGVAVMLWAFGYRQMKELLWKNKKQPPEQSVV